MQALRAGEAIALPTETVYGLGADALDAQAVVKIFEAKERPLFDPLIVHLPDCDWLERLTLVPAEDQRIVSLLTAKFWSGPLTLVLPRTPLVPDIVAAGLGTVAVRISAHPVFGAILRSFGKPVAAPSANRFGRVSPTTAAHVLAELDGRISLIVDDGGTAHGLESTIVAVRAGKLHLLRHGPVTVEQLQQFAEVRIATTAERPQAPGQLPSHYAPTTPLVLAADPSHYRPAQGERTGALVLRELPAASQFAEVRTLSPSGDLREAAANFFRCLRELDAAGLDLIVAEEVQESGIGSAIMDRLRRAAAR